MDTAYAATEQHSARRVAALENTRRETVVSAAVSPRGWVPMTKAVLCSFSLGMLLGSAPTAQGLEPIPDHVVVLTFYDSAKSHFTPVRPLLKEPGFGATFFVTEGFEFRDNKRVYMSWEEIAQLHREGFKIGNHTRDHVALTVPNLEKYADQLETIATRCQEHGIRKPVSFAYPGNAFAVEGFGLLRRQGILFARRGGAPEYDYDSGRGVAYGPERDHPLLIPSAGDGRPHRTPHPAIDRGLSADSQAHQKDHQQRKAHQQANHAAGARSRPKVERPAHPRDRLRNPYAAVTFAEVQPHGPVAGVGPLGVVEFPLIHRARLSSNS